MKSYFQPILLSAVVLMVAACGHKEPETSLQKTGPSTDQPLNYYALVIGVSDYSSTGWPNLGTAGDDAKAMGSVLRDRYGFNVTELTDKQATRGNILRALDRFMQLTANDALLIYFAGHGYYDKQMDEGYWIPYGAKRQRMDQPAKEDWLWNSSINRVLGALPARHVLLVADTCYGGSLFRGDDNPDKSGNWYRRAMSVPSRYLITSGNLEPVLDSGIRHSVFAQQILNYLQYTDEDVFSASDIAISIRSKVSELTGQLVRMGPLASPANAGGEFVFVRGETALPPIEPASETAPQITSFSSTGTRGALEDLANQMERYSSKASDDSFVRPRVLACLGPTGDNPEETAMVRNRLYESLDTIGGCILVEREAFDTLLQEMELGQSRLADKRATTEIGKLLPASLILFGEIIPVGNRQEIHIRIVDTETSRVLSSTSAMFTSYDELEATCQKLARQIMTTVNQARPVLLEANVTDNGTLQAGWGRFHGAHIGDTFKIITREAVGTISQRDVLLGTARLLSLGEETAEFQPEWRNSETNQPASLWLKATL